MFINLTFCMFEDLKYAYMYIIHVACRNKNSKLKTKA